MERVPTDSADKPLEPIKITGVEIFVDPYGECPHSIADRVLRSRLALHG